jgi:hypothetical protein
MGKSAFDARGFSDLTFGDPFRFFFINCIIFFNGFQIFMKGNWNTTDFVVA